MSTDVKEFLENYRQIAEAKEFEYFFHKAAFSRDHSRYLGAEDDHRLPFKRDVDRIVHSKAYARYVDKTQVVYLVENDHISHRSLHVQLVSNFSRGIAEILRLNLDLVEAIALGHDVGHPPFGHEGEGYLSKLSQEAGEGSFAHSAQSCRIYSVIEPLNLGLHVCDGFLCHDGGMKSPVIEPALGKTWERHFEEVSMKNDNPDLNIMPGTLEGCLVKICDTMSYLGRDIEDAISLGILQRSDIPDWEMGRSNREILSYLAQDVIRNSYEKDCIAMSDKTFDQLKQLRKFNFEFIYSHPKLKVESEKIQTSYQILFDFLLRDYDKKGESSYLWTHFLFNKDREYVKSSTPARLVIDYIAGMTDNYFVQTFETLFVPKHIEI